MSDSSSSRIVEAGVSVADLYLHAKMLSMSFECLCEVGGMLTETNVIPQQRKHQRSPLTTSPSTPTGALLGDLMRTTMPSITVCLS